MLYQLSYFRVEKSVGEDGFEPPKSKDNRFTVCPIWPLWYSPVPQRTALRLQIYAHILNAQVRGAVFFKKVRFARFFWTSIAGFSPENDIFDTSKNGIR